ncbi:uncharacterized protein CXQ87_004891 [Candidozyma duobushaemuli]|uniref:Triacylglycerol lipase n=2 Tax=Candidozyma TaxID=3303203 RepID=A0ABX8IC79_9ASCO|nr:uncharacterized protein CXQ87_004891 [[Candida] duobushaemulonis]PVH16596.1 hypothetical protein CXQ87_004891 [[Candida] duobushaemulonis]QWU90355.1 hypothetical protein CA3LBN_004716 [[Candida] haemuloni]
MLILSFFIWAVAVSAQFIKPVKPSDDDFYNTPSNISSYKNGDIIDARPAPGMIRSVYFPVNVKNAWQLLVRSEDSHGNPNAIVTTVLEPYDADPKRVVSYQAAQDSATQDCSPSYSFLFNAPMSTIILQVEMVLIQTALAKGWYVVAPDYEGPKGTFTAGIQSGQATINSLRAALNSEDVTGIDPDAKAALWGYSGGTIASGWAASLQPEYAPELKKNLVGAALGGWVTNITLTAEITDGTIFGGFIPNAINGMLNEYPKVQEILDKELREDKVKPFEEAKEKCLLTSIIHYMFLDFFGGKKPWVNNGWGFFDYPLVKEIVQNNTAALFEDGPRPEIPLFVFHGTEDEIVPFSGAERGYNNYCKWGIDSFEFAVSNTTGHILEWAEGSGAALVWIEKMFNGEKPVDGCKRTERSTNVLYPGADVEYRQLVRTLFSSIKGGEIGETTRNITDSTMVSTIMQHGISALLEKIGPIPFKRDLSEMDILESPEFRGISDVVRRWKQQKA